MIRLIIIDLMVFVDHKEGHSELNQWNCSTL